MGKKCKALNRRVLKGLALIATLFIAIAAIPLPEVGEDIERFVSPEELVEIDGVKVRYQVKGDEGGWVILLHGFGASIFSWRTVIDDLSKSNRVLAVDLPGFGLTERAKPWAPGYNQYTVDGAATLVLRLMDKLGISEAIFLGHSAGGGLALFIALQHPDRVKALVLEAPAWRAREKSIWERILFSLPIISDKLGPLLIRSYIPKFEGVLRSAFYDKSLLTEEVIEGYKHPLKARNWDKGLYWYMKYYQLPNLEPLLGDLRKPILIIHGIYDNIVDPQSSRELGALLSSSTLVEIDECGHIPHEEKPAEFLRAVSGFIQSLNE